MDARSLYHPGCTDPDGLCPASHADRQGIGPDKTENELVHLALAEKDYATHNFLQWYVNEQMEEERVARTLNDKLEMIGDDKSGLYLFDRDIMNYRGKA